MVKEGHLARVSFLNRIESKILVEEAAPHNQVAFVQVTNNGKSSNSFVCRTALSSVLKLLGSGDGRNEVLLDCRSASLWLNCLAKERSQVINGSGSGNEMAIVEIQLMSFACCLTCHMRKWPFWNLSLFEALYCDYLESEVE